MTRQIYIGSSQYGGPCCIVHYLEFWWDWGKIGIYNKLVVDNLQKRRKIKMQYLDSRG